MEQSSLVDIRTVTVHTDLPKKERMLDYIQQIKNPYRYQHGDYTVINTFADTNVTLEDRMIQYIREKSVASSTGTEDL